MTIHVTLTIRDFPHERCIGVDVDAALLGDRVFVGRRGKTKVTDLDVTRGVEKDVPRFQVTVDHTLPSQREDIMYHNNITIGCAWLSVARLAKVKVVVTQVCHGYCLVKIVTHVHVCISKY